MKDLADTRSASRESILKLEDAMFEHEQVDIQTTHHFADGIYAREIFIPKGVLLTGKIHKTEHLNIVSKGRIAVATEFGNKIVEAPCTMVSAPGTKRVGYAEEDTIWITIHASKETDLDALEKELISPSYEDYLLESEAKEQLEEKSCLG